MSSRPLRRRARISLWTRLRIFWVVIVATFIIAAAAGYALVTSPAFRLRELTVTGNHVVSRRAIIAAAAIPLDADVWTLDTRAITRRIEAIPFVATATVHRHFPADVELAVSERTVTACLRADGGTFTIDAGRRVLATTCLRQDVPRFFLPLKTSPKPGDFIVDPDLGRMQRDLAIFERAGLSVGTLSFDRFGSLDATTRDGLLIRCGDDGDLEKKVALIGPILAATKDRLRHVVAVDLRAPGTPVVTYR
jgi:hypothetical protein